MNARPMLAVLAIVALGGCHRRFFEKEQPRGDVMVVSTTVITNADVPVTEPQPAPAPAATAATATPAVPATPAPAAPSAVPTVTDPLPTREELARDAGATAAPARPATAPSSAEQPKTDEPAPYHHPSAADRIPWAGDSNEGR